MNQQIADYYASNDLITIIGAGIDAALAKKGLDRTSLQRSDLGPVDEFHVGGHEATRLFCDNMPVIRKQRLLDIGCGIGGPARFIADQFGCHVTGVDLTADYIDAGNQLSKWVGLAERVSLHHGSAIDLPFDDDAFDLAYMIHVGMNIEDKIGLAENAFRVIRPGGCFAIFDVMKTGSGTPLYPLPWAQDDSMNAACAPEIYRDALSKAGFMMISEIDRTELANEFFDKMMAANANRDGPPPLGLHLLMGPTAPQKFANIARQIQSGMFAPIEIIAKKP